MNVQAKISKTLYFILFSLLLILLRVWTLSVVQREEKILEGEKPKHRSLFVKAPRGVILDRFHEPLAVNKICYHAAICYSEISEIPSISWGKDELGKKVKVYSRKNYIKNLAKLLAKTLQMDFERVEDLIHSKASLFPHVPFVLKANLTEEEHFRLKFLEKDWPGLYAEIGSTRFYPQGKVASHIVGTLGKINSEKYASLANEMKELQDSITLYEQGLASSLPKGYTSFEAVSFRLAELKEKAYSFNDFVGKSGIEARFEEKLRGFYGKKCFEVDQKGRFLKEVFGGKKAIAGHRVVLSISSELQKFAEKLLIESEKEREGKSTFKDPKAPLKKAQKQPWIKGGAILALDPKTGEVLAMASHPGFDPNDFVSEKTASPFQSKINEYLENENSIASLWDGLSYLERDVGKIETRPLSWKFFLENLLPKENPIWLFLEKNFTLKQAILIQEDFEALLYFSKETPLTLIKTLLSKSEPLFFTLSKHQDANFHLKRFLQALIPMPAEDLLFSLDLLKICVDASRFTDSLIPKMAQIKLETYRDLCQAFHRVESHLKTIYQKKFHQEEFQSWKKEYKKEFLLAKRKEEKEKKTYARPYLDYLDQKEKELFLKFWQENRLFLFAKVLTDSLENLNKGAIDTSDFHKDLLFLQELVKHFSFQELVDFMRTFRKFEELQKPLFLNYPSLKRRKGGALEKDLARAFYPLEGFGFLRSYGFQSASPLGSIFKLVTGYEALKQNLGSFSLIDKVIKSGSKQIVSYSLNHTPYPRIYKGGRLPRSSSPYIGQVDLVKALEQSSNPFFSILAGDHFEDPNDLKKTAKEFGFGEKTGIELAGEVRGNLPTDLEKNKTGLYSFAIGQHTFLSTPLQAAQMLLALANKGKVLKPKITLSNQGLNPKRGKMEAFSSENVFMKEQLQSLGIYFPLFTKPYIPSTTSDCKAFSSEVKRELFMPPSFSDLLFEGMDRAVWGEKGSARPYIISSLTANPKNLKDYLSLKHQMIGKTSTSQVVYKMNLNPSSSSEIYKHIWFGAISFEEDPITEKINRENPELVVVVFLRFGSSGKDAAPLAARLIHKWREIKKKHAL